MIGAVLAGGVTAAAAEVTVFGHLDTSVLNYDIDYNNPLSSDEDDTNFVCTTCSIGFKGSEDLGNGLKAIFKIDFQYDMFNRNPTRANGVPQDTFGTTAGSSVYSTTTKASVVHTSAITDRDQWLGLAGNFGQVRFGTISTSYKSHGAMIDPVYRTVVQGRDLGHQSNLHKGAGEEGQGRATNTVRYDTPNWNGLQAAAHFTLDSDEYPKEDENPWGVGAQYKNGGILVFADYITNNRGGSDDAWKVGGKYTLNNFAVFGQYESDGGLISSKGITAGPTSKSRENQLDGADTWFVGATYPMGNNTIYAAYGEADDPSGSPSDPLNLVNTGYDVWHIAGMHSLSKRTTAYAAYAQISDDGNLTGADSDLMTVGLKHKF